MSVFHRRPFSAGWTEFIPAEESDYLLPSRRYMAFEGSLVSFLTRQDIIQPNHITYFRFVICLVLFCLYPHLSYPQILILATLGALSDFFDGALARAASKKTRLGMVIDPLADKLLAFILVYILLMRKAIDPLYLVFMLLVEAHLVLIPLLSWSYAMIRTRKARTASASLWPGKDGFVVKSREILMGKIKVFLYGLGFFTILTARAFDVMFLSKVAEGLLVLGIAAGTVALLLYLLRWFRRPYGIS